MHTCSDCMAGETGQRLGLLAGAANRQLHHPPSQACSLWLVDHAMDAMDRGPWIAHMGAQAVPIMQASTWQASEAHSFCTGLRAVRPLAHHPLGLGLLAPPNLRRIPHESIESSRKTPLPLFACLRDRFTSLAAGSSPPSPSTLLILLCRLSAAVLYSSDNCRAHILFSA